MPPPWTTRGARLTSSLNEARNDTGRIAFCGPIVLSAITGYSVSKVEDEIRAFRDPDAGRQDRSSRAPTPRRWPPRSPTSATAWSSRRATCTSPRKERPSLWTWMQKPRNAWVHYILAIHKGKEGHWVLIKGVKLCDTYSRGALAVRVRRPAQGRAHHGGVRGAEGAGVFDGPCAGPSKQR